MEERNYVVIDISGEYATLKDENDGSEIFIAMALLPFGVDVQTRLHFENLQYEIIE